MARSIKVRLWLYVAMFAMISAPSQARESFSDISKKVQSAVTRVTAFDDRGNAVASANGFFISPANIVTSRKIISGSEVQVTSSTGTVFQVKGLTADDPAHGLAIITLTAPAAGISPLKITAVYPYKNEKVALMSCDMAGKCRFQETLITDVIQVPGKGNLMTLSIKAPAGSAGSPIVNIKGDVVGVAMDGFSRDGRLSYAVPGEQVLAMKPGTVKPFTASKPAGTGGGPVSPLAAGMAMLEGNDYEGAIPYLQRAVDQDPSNHEGWFLLGHSYYMLDRYPESITAFRRAISASPGFQPAYVALGFALSESGLNDEAINTLKQAVALDENEPYAHFGLGGAYIRSGDRMKALDEYVTLRRLSPELAASLLDLIKNIE